jgi:hypothetical protein
MSGRKDSLPNLDELIWVEDLRSNRRFIVRRPLVGELEGEHADVRDLSSSGFRIAHRIPLRIGSNARLKIRTESREPVPFQTTVVWSHLSDNRDPDDALLYTSGMRIEDDREGVGDEVAQLFDSHCRPDTTSMETKRLLALERLMDRITVERELLKDLDPAALLLSYQALGDVSRLNAEEKESLVQKAKEMLALTSLPSAWHHDVLAAWSLIDRKVGLTTIQAARKILFEIDRFVDAHDEPA